MKNTKTEKEFKQTTVFCRHEEEYLVLDSPVNWSLSTPEADYIHEVSTRYFDTLHTKVENKSASIASTGCNALLGKVTLDWDINYPENITGTYIRYIISSRIPIILQELSCILSTGKSLTLVKDTRIFPGSVVQSETVIPYTGVYLQARLRMMSLPGVECVVRSPTAAYTTTVRVFNPPSEPHRLYVITAKNILSTIKLGLIQDNVKQSPIITTHHTQHKIHNNISYPEHLKHYHTSPTTMGLYAEDNSKGFLSVCSSIHTTRRTRLQFLYTL